MHCPGRHEALRVLFVASQNNAKLSSAGAGGQAGGHAGTRAARPGGRGDGTDTAGAQHHGGGAGAGAEPPPGAESHEVAPPPSELLLEDAAEVALMDDSAAAATTALDAIAPWASVPNAEQLQRKRAGLPAPDGAVRAVVQKAVATRIASSRGTGKPRVARPWSPSRTRTGSRPG